MQPQTDTRELPNQAQLDLIARWPEIRKLWQSTLFGAFATTGPDGPQITPIGSVFLHESEPRGYFNPIFAARLLKTLSSDQRFELLFVDTSPLRWMSGLIRGRFDRLVQLPRRG